MTAPRRLSNNRISDYGCGLALRVQNGRQVLSHNGAVSGFNAWSAMVPSTRSSVIMVCNVEGGLGAVPGQIFGLLLKERTSLPKVAAPPAVETAKALFSQFRKDAVDRRQLAEEYDIYLTPAKLTEASKRLRPYRSLKKAELVETHERGGMEVSTTRLTFANGVIRAQMYRRPDGKVEQYFLSAD